MNQEFTKVINNIQAHLTNELNSVNNIILKKIDSDIHLIPNLAKHIINSGGKRIRPILALLSAKMFNEKYKNNLAENHIYISAAVEFIHTATLLHDDVIDENKTRRAKETANNIWGNKPAILVGDFLFAKAFELMVETNNLKVLHLLAKTSAIITEGEILQLTYLNNCKINLDIYMKIINSKTSILFSSAAQSGALLSNANSNEEVLMSNYANNLGISFQIVDDILDYTADEKTLGKTIGTDLKEGKITLPIILLLEQANITEKQAIINIFENLNQDKQSFSIVLNLLKKYNIDNQCYKIANDYINLSLENLQQLNINNQYYNYLYNLSSSSKTREY